MQALSFDYEVKAIGKELAAATAIKAADLHLHVVFLDHQAWPDHIEQFGLGDEPVAPLDQRQQQVEGARTDARGAPSIATAARGAALRLGQNAPIQAGVL